MEEVESKPYFVPYTSENHNDIYDIELDAISLIEMFGICGNVDPSETLALTTFKSTQAWIIYDASGKPDGVFGITDLGFNTGSPWLLHSGNVAKNHKREFLEGSFEIMQIFMSNYSEMYNYVWVDHIEAHRWLSKLGFTVDKTFKHSFAKNDIQFYKFYYKG